MASPRTGSDELIHVETDCVAVTIKGPASHPDFPGVTYEEGESALKVACLQPFSLEIQEKETDAPILKGVSYIAQQKILPLFFEQQNYELLIEAKGDHIVSFWHDNFSIRNKVTPVGRKANLLSGIINFGNEIGYTDLVIQMDGRAYLWITLEIFPTKIDYREDYKAIMADVTSEIYNIVFDVLKKTYLHYGPNGSTGNSPVEFFAIIRTIFRDMLRAADLVLAQPHHVLQTTHEVEKQYKIKRMDSRTVRWLEKHSENVMRTKSGFRVDRALAVKKQVSYNTRENRLVKYILMSTVRKLSSFEHQYVLLQRDTDPAIVKEIHSMMGELNRRANSGFLREIAAGESDAGMSLVITMAPGYRDLYKYYLMLLRGLSVTGGIFSISVKDLAQLYEYWCFIKLNSILKEHYELVSQDVVRIQGNGLFVSLVKGQASKVRYRNPKTGESIILSYNPKETDLPTVPQRPDNVLTLEKKGADIQYEYVLDAKYKIDPALPGTDYYQHIDHTPGPQEGDINTMHRYRDAIVYHNGASPFERTMYGAYVLFPYRNEEEYQHHRFYKSIEKVNIGGLPFLPSATRLVTGMLDELISESPVSAQERASLPRGIEEKLVKVDWNRRDVFVGTLKTRAQLDVCLDHLFYHVPKEHIQDNKLPIHYVAIYQSKRLFDRKSGIYYYGEVIRCSLVRRREITEIPCSKGREEVLYYRLDVREWTKLKVPIAIKEIRPLKAGFFTNLFLLQHSRETPELLIQNEAEYRLYYELKRTADDLQINEDKALSFTYRDVQILFDKEDILLCRGSRIIGKHSIRDFRSHPHAVFQVIQREIG